MTIEHLNQDTKDVLNHAETVIEGMHNDGYGTEIDVSTVHASQLGYCKRQMYLKKLGLSEVPGWLIKTFNTGTAYHSMLEHETRELANTKKDMARPSLEDGISFTFPENTDTLAVHVIGKADVVTTDAVIDWKTTAGLDYIRGGPKEYHIDQIHAYMYGHGKDTAVLNYISTKKGQDRVVRHVIEFDGLVLARALDRAMDVIGVIDMVQTECIDKYGEFTVDTVKRYHEDHMGTIPFEKCERDNGDPCFMCDKEKLAVDLDGDNQ